MQDLKTGHLLHASPRAQFYGQLIGSTLSIFVSATAYRLYVRAYAIPSPNFPAPTAFVWLSLARLLRNGSLPPHSSEYMLWFGLVAICIAAVKVRASATARPWAKWVPSGVAFAMGFLNTPNFSMARLVGGLVEVWYHRRQRLRRQSDGKEMDEDGSGSSGIGIIIVASGFVLGEVRCYHKLCCWKRLRADVDFVGCRERSRVGPQVVRCPGQLLGLLGWYLPNLSRMIGRSLQSLSSITSHLLVLFLYNRTLADTAYQGRQRAIPLRAIANIAVTGLADLPHVILTWTVRGDRRTEVPTSSRLHSTHYLISTTSSFHLDYSYPSSTSLTPLPTTRERPHVPLREK